MTCSGFKTAQKNRNLKKKENNNKDYRSKMKAFSFSNGYISYDYILRTKYNIKLTKSEIDNYIKEEQVNRGQYKFKNYNNEENIIIHEELKKYFTAPIICAYDKTHTPHSKSLTRNRNYDRKQKWDSLHY